MIGLQPVRSQADEPAWGHVLRAALAGGSRSARDLGVSGRRTRPIVRYLASCDGVSARDYLAMHGDRLLVRSGCHYSANYGPSCGYALGSGGQGARRTIAPRACRTCVEEATSQFGYAWFQRRHNLAGVATCLHHGERLFVAGTATERFELSVSLAQLESRARNATTFAYADDFVRRYELALLTLAQRKGNRGHWRTLVRVIKRQLAARGVPSNGATIVQLVTDRANEAWLSETFMDSGRHDVALLSALAETLQRPTYAYHLSLILAATFDDLAELSVVLSAHECGRRIKPLLKAAGCKLRRCNVNVSEQRVW